MVVTLTQLIGLATIVAQDASESSDDAPAAKSVSADQVRVADGKLVAVADGKSFTPTNIVSLPFKIRVMTNLTFTVDGGKPRKLEDGQVLSKDGTLQSPDGSIMPVLDHVTQKDGKILVYRDGVATPVVGEVTLGDGSRILADGTYIDKSGRPTKLMDGQLVRLNGSTLLATDTATLKGGKVIVQKDGSLITLGHNQTMMMSDGTKVFGDGNVISRDGTSKSLAEGEILHIEGVRRR